MRFINDEADDVYARWDPEYARWDPEEVQLRAMARRQLALGIPIVILGALIAAIPTFALSRPTPPSHERRAPIDAPTPTPHRHAIALLLADHG